MVSNEMKDSIIKHDSDVLVQLRCVDNGWLMFWYDFGRSECVNRLETLQVSPKRVHLA